MRNRPLVSIIIPYHKKKLYFKSTLKSILSQSYQNFEIILIYDDINLNELNFIRKEMKKVIKKKLILNKKILGPGLSRNKGILKAKGKYIAFCDADDIWKKNKLKFQLDFMEKNKLDFSHSSYDIIDSKNIKIGQFRIKSKVNFKNLMKSCDIGLSTVVMKKKLIQANSKFCNLRTKEDYFLWLQIIKKTKYIFGIKKFLVSWRQNKGSLSDSFYQKISDAFRLFYFYEKYNVFISCVFVLRLSFYALIKKIKIYN